MTEKRTAKLAVVTMAMLSLAGCATFPELDRKVDPAVMAAPYPAFLPFEAITPPPPPPPTITADLAAQGAALNARADAQNSQP